MTDPKIAIISDQLAGGIGGAESILFAAHELFPEAPVYTTVLKQEIVPEPYQSSIDFRTTFIQQLPMARDKYKAYLPIMPLAIEYLNLQEYDVLFSSHHSVAKGIIPRPDAVHICYCHSPARYIWDLFWTYADLNRFGPLQKIMVSAVSQYLRMWDVTSSNRVDHFLANSSYTAQRIKKFYNRDAEVLHPPVNTSRFQHQGTEDYYLMVGRLVAYKGYELAVEAFNESGKPLVIIGGGAEYEHLKAMAKPNVRLLGKAPDDVLTHYMNHCKGFIFPGKEDFGIVMAEAQSAGKPVLAFGAGGALDIVRDRETGVLFDEQTPQALNKAVLEAEFIHWDPEAIANHAKQFDVSRFKARLHDILLNADAYSSFSKKHVLQAVEPGKVLAFPGKH